MRRTAYISTHDDDAGVFVCFGGLVRDEILTISLSVPIVPNNGPDVWDGVRVLAGAPGRVADTGLRHVMTTTGGVDDHWLVSSEFRIGPDELPKQIELILQHGPATHTIRLRQVWST